MLILEWTIKVVAIVFNWVSVFYHDHLSELVITNQVPGRSSEIVSGGMDCKIHHR